MHDWADDRIYQRACLGLVRLGYEVHLVATKSEESPGESEIRFHWVRPRQGWRRRLFSSWEAVKRAGAVRADIYHFHDPDILVFAWLLRKMAPHAKIVYDIHENYAARLAQWGLPSFLGRMYRFFEKKVLRKLSGFCVVSDEMLNLFLDLDTPSVVVRNSVDLSRLRGVDFSYDAYPIPTIYTSGTNSHERHCLETVKALKFIMQDYAVCRMLFVGKYNGGIDNEMLAQAKADGTEGYLSLEGMLPWEENFQRTRRAYCGCVFYAPNDNNKVGLPNRLFEYMFCGIPVIVSDFPALRAVVEDLNCGIVVDSRDPKSIADGVLKLLKAPAMARDMGKRGRAGVESKYGFHVDLARLSEFYRTI